MMDAHAKSAFVATELSIPLMRKNGTGSIVNIGPIQPIMNAPDFVLYSAAKGALEGLTTAYSVELASEIRVNMISPGNVNTERNLAHLVLYLLSPLSNAVTGYIINCGYTRYGILAGNK